MILDHFWFRSFLAIAGVLTSTPAFSGKLSEFEEATNGARKDQSPARETAADAVEAGWFSGLMHSLFGTEPEQELSGEPKARAEYDHRIGDARLAYLRTDAAYFHIDDDVHAFDGRVEAGWEILAADYRSTRFHEHPSRDVLDISQMHVLIRAPVTERFQVGLGVGGMVVDGGSQSAGLSLLLPALWYVADHVAFEFRGVAASINERAVYDVDVSAGIFPRFGALRVGYRYLDASGASLHGPYAGVSLYF